MYPSALSAYLMILLTMLGTALHANATATNSAVDYIRLSQDFLYAAKTGENTAAYQDTLKQVAPETLSAILNTDAKRLAFWLNIYNGFTQVILKKNTDKYKSRGAFFSDKQIGIAGKQISLDMLEHGLLRRSKIKWSLGYLNKLFPSAFEKRFRVEELDYRIHFALNCGAKSCPPIAFYMPEELDKQLDLATQTYLKGEASYNKETNTVEVPMLMSWFRKDFGSKKGILKILTKNNIIPAGAKPAITYKKYDWDLYLDNYKTENNG